MPDPTSFLAGYIAGKALDRVLNKAGRNFGRLHLRLRVQSNWLYVLSILMLFIAAVQSRTGQMEEARKSAGVFWKGIVVAGAIQATYSKDAERRLVELAHSLGVAT